MRWLFWLLVLAGLAAVAAVAARYNDGYALLVLPPYRVELSLNLLLVLLLLAFLLVHWLLRLVASVLDLPRQVARYRERRRFEKGQQLFHEAFRLLFEGRFGQALKKAGESFDAGIDRGLSALIAARAAQRMRRGDEQQMWLQRASEIDKESQPARLMLEAEMSLDGHDYPAALAALDALKKLAGRNLAAQRLELRARQGVGDWPGVLELARILEKRGVLAPEVAGELKLRAHRENLLARREDTRGLLAYLRELPEAEQSKRLTATAAQLLIDAEAREEAARLIEAQLARGWDSSLAELYGQCGDERPAARIAEAEKWLQAHRDDARLLLALGRLCVRQQLWGKAQSYFEASLSIEETRDAHLELAWLAERLDNDEEAARRYRLASKPELCHCG
jgi:HemY protein